MGSCYPSQSVGHKIGLPLIKTYKKSLGNEKERFNNYLKYNDKQESLEICY